MSDEKNFVFVGDSLSTAHLTKNLGTLVEKGLTTQHLTAQLSVPVSQPISTLAPQPSSTPTAPAKK